MKQLNAFKKALETKKIMKGMVKYVQFHKELDTDVLVVDLDGVKVVIVRDEIDAELNWKSLVSFVGREVNFTIQSIDEEAGILFGSRKEAQQIQKDVVVERLMEGEIFSATVVNILNYGAFVDIEGISGLIKNVDFAEDYTTIGDVLKKGSKINIKLKKVTNTNKLIFEAVEKYRNPTIMNFDEFEPNQVVYGVIRDIKPWGVYVCIAPGLDGLCSIPPTGEIEQGMKVSFRIVTVNKEEQRVRGKIVKSLA